jgi:hypothetical protein
VAEFFDRLTFRSGAIHPMVLSGSKADAECAGSDEKCVGLAEMVPLRTGMSRGRG